jgi:hypothetical protein
VAFTRGIQETLTSKNVLEKADQDCIIQNP